MKNPFALLFLSIFLFVSCSRNTTAVKQSSQALNVALKSHESAAGILDKMSQQSKDAASAGQIEASTNEDIQNYVHAERIKIDETTKKLQSAQKDIDDYTSKKSSKKQIEVLNEANKVVQESSDLLRILEKKTEVIVDFLGSETFSKSEIGALFRPGEYQLIKGQIKEGQRLFSPIVEKLFSFAEKYKGSFASLKGEIIVTGYSDGTAVERGSGLYRDLARRLSESDGVTEPAPEDLNQKLSELRAGAVKGLLEDIIIKKNKENPDRIEISVSILGRGEEIPKGLPADISKSDSRRRVVTFYWVVLPKL